MMMTRSPVGMKMKMMYHNRTRTKIKTWSMMKKSQRPMLKKNHRPMLKKSQWPMNKKLKKTISKMPKVMMPMTSKRMVLWKKRHQLSSNNQRNRPRMRMRAIMEMTMLRRTSQWIKRKNQKLIWKYQVKNKTNYLQARFKWITFPQLKYKWMAEVKQTALLTKALLNPNNMVSLHSEAFEKSH